MTQTSFAISHFAAIGLLAGVSYVIGRRMLAVLLPNHTAPEIPLSTGLGLGAVAYVVLILGAFGLFKPAFVVPALLALSAGSYSVWLPWLRGAPAALNRVRQINRIHLAAGGLVVVAGIILLKVLLGASSFAWILPLYPPTMFDATMLHLMEAKNYVDTGLIGELENLRRPLHANLTSMLFALMMLFHDDISAQLVPFLAMIVTTGLVYSWAKQWKSRTAGVWAAAIFLSSPIVLWVSSISYLDMGVAMFVAMGAYAFWLWLEKKETGWLAVAAVSLAFAASTKPNGVFWLLAFGVAVLLASGMRRQLKPILIFAAAALIALSPWYIRSYVITGGTTQALHGSVLAEVVGTFRTMGARLNPGNGGDTAKAENTSGDPTPAKSATGQPALGVSNILQQWSTAAFPPFFNSMSTVFLYLIPFVAIVAIRRLRVAVIVFVCALFVYRTTQQYWIDMRYFLPVLPLLSTVTAVSLYSVLRALASPWTLPLLASRWPVNSVPNPRNSDLAGRLAVLAVGSVIIYGAGIGASATWAKEYIGRLGPVPTSAESRETYLERKLPAYPVYRYLNDTAGDKYRAYAWGYENMNYFAQGEHVTDWYGPNGYGEIHKSMGSGAALYAEMKRMDIDYLIFEITGPYEDQLPKDAFFRAAFEFIVQHEDTLLYQVRADRPTADEIAQANRSPESGTQPRMSLTAKETSSRGSP